MKILFTSPVLEFPPADGPALRICNSIKALNKVSDLHILSRKYKYLMGGDVAEEYYKNLCTHFEYAPSVGSGTLNKLFYLTEVKRVTKLNSVANIISRLIYKLSSGVAEDAEYIAQYVIKNRIDIIWFGYGNISFELMKLVRCKLPLIKIVCDTDSVWSRFILRELEVSTNLINKNEIKREGLKKENEEKEWQTFVDVTTAVSDVDANYYKAISENPNNVKIFSNVIDLDMYSKAPAQPINFKSPCIYLAGSFWERSPMEHASRWFINEVFPLIKEAIPSIHLYIIGKNSDLILSDIDNQSITITGKLSSVLPYLCHANVAIVPLFFESGTRFKILEAAAAGVPMVSTTLGAEGIPVRDCIEMLIADEPKDFSQAVIRIIQNPNLAADLAINCKKLIEKNYSVDAQVKEANEILDFLSKIEVKAING